MDLSKIRIEGGYAFFYGSFLSQWYRTDITPEYNLCNDSRIIVAEEILKNTGISITNITFSSAEQFMMYCKAMLMSDIKTANKILYTTDPSEAKKLGRAVGGYKDSVWCKYREHIVLLGNYYKFKNSDLSNGILEVISISRNSNFGKTPKFVEASPYDTIWGIGVGITNDSILCMSNWKGLNLLGKQLDIVADIIVK